MERPFAFIGHPILRKKAQPITSIDASILKLIEDMKETLLHTSNGVALAAPQIGVPLQLFIVRRLENPEDISTATKECLVFINPHIVEVSKTTWTQEEGCLSIPQLYRPVERPQEIVLTYQDETGKTFTERYSGWMAKILLHENDHLHGNFFIDRLSKKEKSALSPEIDKTKKQFSSHNHHLKVWPFS